MKIDTSFVPMPPEIIPSIFKEMYIEAISNKESDLSLFVKYIDPFINMVTHSIKNKNKSYYFYLFLLKNILSFTDESSIDRWIQTQTIKEDIQFILIKRLRRIKTIPSQAQPVMAQFYFVTDLRLAISNYIKKNYKNNKRVTHIIPDQIYSTKIKEKPKNNWYNYLVTMITLGYTITEISNLTGYSRTTIYKELKKYGNYKKTSD